MDIQQEVQVVERELLEIIAKHLIDNKIEVATARKMAKDFLATLPIAHQQNFLTKLKQLGETYEEVQEVYVDELGKVSNEERDKVLTQMRDALRQGNIDHAVTLAKTRKGTN